MLLYEMLNQAVSKEEGQYKINDLDIHSEKCGLDISIWWHSACYNVGYYPIVQVDGNEGNMILWKSGTEIPADWHRWLEEILEDYLDIDDWMCVSEERW